MLLCGTAKTQFEERSLVFFEQDINGYLPDN
jgi:hypothetical protein